MTRAALLRKLRSLEACDDAVAWLESTDHATFQAAWDGCERADWMLWLLDKLGADKKLMVHLACDMADSVQHLWLARLPDDDRPANAIRTARAWCEGKATREDCAGAARAAWAAGAAWAAWAAARAAGAAQAAEAAARAAGAAQAAGAAGAAGAEWAAGAAGAEWAAGAAGAEWAAWAGLIRKRVPNPEEVAL